jgi:hypothetical protein
MWAFRSVPAVEVEHRARGTIRIVSSSSGPLLVNPASHRSRDTQRHIVPLPITPMCLPNLQDSRFIKKDPANCAFVKHPVLSELLRRKVTFQSRARAVLKIDWNAFSTLLATIVPVVFTLNSGLGINSQPAVWTIGFIVRHDLLHPSAKVPIAVLSAASPIPNRVYAN